MSIDLACVLSDYGTPLASDKEPPISDFHSSDSDFFTSDGDLFPVPQISAVPKQSDRLRLTKKWYSLQKRKKRKINSNHSTKSNGKRKSKIKSKSKSNGKKKKRKEQIRSGYVHRVSPSKCSQQSFEQEEPDSSSSPGVEKIGSNIYGFQKKPKKKTCVDFVCAFPGQGMRTGRRLLSAGRKKSQAKLLRTKFINCLQKKFLY